MEDISTTRELTRFFTQNAVMLSVIASAMVQWQVENSIPETDGLLLITLSIEVGARPLRGKSLVVCNVLVMKITVRSDINTSTEHTLLEQCATFLRSVNDGSQDETNIIRRS